jgi:hypothetical protein
MASGLLAPSAPLQRALAPSSVFVVLIGQATQKGHERRLLIVIKEQWSDQGREMGIGPPASAIELHHIFKRGEASIVHVWGRSRNIAKQWRAKRPPFSIDPRMPVAARIGKSARPVPDTQVVELEIRKQWPAVCSTIGPQGKQLMAVAAPSSTVEDMEPIIFQWRQYRFIAQQEPIYATGSRH